MTGFYRRTTNTDGEPDFDHAPNFVYAPDFTLLASRDRGTHDGWEYHETAPAWAQPEGAHDLPYQTGDIVTTANGEQWQSTVDNNVWKPGESGWRPYVADGPAPWQQPTGAHDAYDKGDTVTHNGQTWTSNVGANVWEPGVHGWTAQTDGDDGPQAWAQPTGAHDSYKAGDTVTHNGNTWTSNIDGNVWEPGIHGWTRNS